MVVIHIPDTLYARILERARVLETPPEALAMQALQQYLWQTEFDDLLAAVHARTRHISSDEIEADITAAAAEVHTG